MKNKAQVESIILFIGLIVAVFVVSIFILRLTNSVLTPFANALQPINNQSAQIVESIRVNFGHVWDWVIILLFLLNLILLFVSAFMVDIHPAFLIVYIVAIFFLVIFGSTFSDMLGYIWGMTATEVELSQTPLQQFIVNNFNLVMLGVIVLSGVVMYAKFKLFNGQGAGGNY